MSITEEELRWYRENTLSKINASETEFCNFHNVSSLREYLEKDKNGMIECFLADQYSLRSNYVKSLLLEVLQKIPLYDLDEIIGDNQTVIKEINSSECYSTENVEWAILLYKPDFTQRSKKFGIFTIAHEIAHRKLKHKPLFGSDIENPNILEEQANALAQKWGFEVPKGWIRHNLGRNLQPIIRKSKR
jgi:hypothetical protein